MDYYKEYKKYKRKYKQLAGASVIPQTYLYTTNGWISSINVTGLTNSRRGYFTDSGGRYYPMLKSNVSDKYLLEYDRQGTYYLYDDVNKISVPITQQPYSIFNMNKVTFKDKHGIVFVLFDTSKNTFILNSQKSSP